MILIPDANSKLCGTSILRKAFSKINSQLTDNLGDEKKQIIDSTYTLCLDVQCIIKHRKRKSCCVLFGNKCYWNIIVFLIYGLASDNVLCRDFIIVIVALTVH